MKINIKRGLPYLVVILVTFLFAHPVFADTAATNIKADTTWTLANSPYVATDTISVFAGATLTIEPGVTIKFETEKKLQVAGTLIARGNKNNPIHFTSNNPSQKWGGIVFLDGAVNANVGADYTYISGSALEYAEIEKSAWSCVDIHNTSPLIAHSNIHNCGPGITTQTSSTSAIIYSNSIHDNAHDNGIWIANASGSLRVVNNLIYGNGNGISMVNGNSGALISANAILDNEMGVSSENGKNFTIEYNAISNAITNNTSFAIEVVGGSNGNIQHNFLNNDSKFVSSNATVLIAGTDPIIQNNIITGSADSVLRLNCGCTNITLNNIRNTGAGYLVRATSADNILAPNNYWNTNNSGEIATGIFDHNDDPTVGLVTFEPHLSSALVFPPLATLSGLPPSSTNQSSANITVGGSDIVSYKYKLDTGYYSEEAPVGNPITLSGLSDGTHTISVVGKDSSGAWQIMSAGSATIYTWVVETAAPDTTPPVFVGVSFSPTTVDVSAGATTTTASVHITDVGTGVRSFRVFLTGPTNVLLNCGPATLQSGTINDGTWTCPITFPQGSVAGLWRFTQVDGFDNSLNSASVSGAAATQLASGVTAINPTPPVTLNSIAITHAATKLSYTVGDALDITGLVVTGTYSDSTTAPIAITTANVTGFNSSTPVTGQVLTITIGGKTATYTINVVAALSSAKAITAFSFANPAATGVINEATHTITVTVPFGTDVTALTPTITVSTGASVSPLSGAAHNFTSTSTYTVTAADSSTQAYVVTVTAAPATTKAITAFSFSTPTATGVINEDTHTIAVTVPFGTNVTALVPTIVITGASVNPASGVAQDFTSPQTYTVTAANSSTQAYTVTITVAANSAKDITSFNFAGLTPSVTGIISGTNITLNVPFGTVITALVPSIAITGASISPNTGSVNDFTNPVTYTVTAIDTTTKVYTITVIVAQPSDLTALVAAITVAQNKHDTAVEGNLLGQYPAPFKANLQIAINTASAITSASAQSVVDAAVTTLNAAVVTFKAGIVLPDTTPPVITLNGSATTTVALGNTFTDPGATATDAVDGTDTVVIGGTVNTAVAGTYTITYNAVDAAGNHATQKTRNVVVSGTILAVTTTTNPDGTKTGTETNAATSTTSTSAGNMTVEMPANLTITGPSGWDGTINLPTVTTLFTLTPDSGNTASAVSAIEIGFSNTPLTLDKAVKLTFAGLAGKLIGWSQSSTFHQITATCNSATVPTLAAGADCKIDVGSDLVVWTKHFTTFVTYTQTAIPTPTPAPSGGGGGGGGGSVTPPASTPTTKKGDINNDGKVDKYDFSLMMANWGKTGLNSSDLNGDNKVDKYDFALLMSNWGK